MHSSATKNHYVRSQNTINLTSSGWHMAGTLVMWAARIVRRVRYFSTNPSSKYLFSERRAMIAAKLSRPNQQNCYFIICQITQPSFAFLLYLFLKHLDLEILIVTSSGNPTNNKTSCESNFYQLIWNFYQSEIFVHEAENAICCFIVHYIILQISFLSSFGIEDQAFIDIIFTQNLSDHLQSLGQKKFSQVKFKF